MSLFKSREFWTTNSDNLKEEYDCMSLKLSKLNSENDYILCGSHMGMLRIYKPSCHFSKGSIAGYRPSDLFVEKELGAPILQVDGGRLVSGSPLTQIAILHPRSFGVYSFTIKQGTTEQGNQNMVNLLYEHRLRRSAANFIIGQFGNIQNRDFIAVQSLDGMISFYEQETFVFCCFLPDFLLPGNLIYMKRTDCFVITGSAMTIESYSYKNLSSAGQNSDEADAGGTKCHTDWSITVNEHILEVEYLYDGFSKESYIVAMGEKNLFCVNDVGKIKFIKRFDFAPITMTTFLINDNIMTSIVAETATLLIYENTSLKWSAQLPETPVAIARGHFRGLRGVFVTLGEFGNLSCSYLGTQPNLFQAPPLQSVDLDYEDADRELTELTKIIKSSYNELKGANNTTDLIITCRVDSIDPIRQTARIEAILIANSVFEEVNVYIHVAKPLIASPNLFALDGSMSAQTKVTSTIHIKPTDTDTRCLKSIELISSLDVEIVASCVSTLTIPKVIRHVVTLAPGFAYVATNPQKESRLKLVLNINDTAPSLMDLFPEFGDINAPNTLALKLNVNQSQPDNADVVTMLLAKSSSRYRLQGDRLCGLYLPLKMIIGRLKEHFKSSRNFTISYSGSIPIKELVNDVKNHYTVTQNIERNQLQLVELSGQFRMIQKRLISKFRDRHPVPLQNLNMLLQATYNEILLVTEKVEQLSQQLQQYQSCLFNSISIIGILLQLSNDNIDEVLLSSLFNVPVVDVEGLQWEDNMDACISYLLRTVLAKSEKDKLRGIMECYEKVTDFTKFEKHLTTLFDRLLKKGMKIQEENENYPTEETDLNEEKTTAIGNKYAEMSTRVLSAKHRQSMEPINNNA